MANAFPIAILIIIVVVAIGIFYFSGKGILGGSSNNKGETTNTTVPTSVTSITPTLPTTSTIPTSTSTTTIPNYCESNRSSVLIYNGNFSTGTFTGWTTSGSGFGNGPLNLTYANTYYDYYQKPWSNYGGTYAATTFTRVNTQTVNPLLPGTISTNFVVVEPYLNFQIYSPKNKSLYVRIVSSNGESSIVAHYNSLNATNTVSAFVTAGLNMSALMCQAVTLSVVSNVTEAISSSESQFMAVGNFYQSQSSAETRGILVNLTQHYAPG